MTFAAAGDKAAMTCRAPFWRNTSRIFAKHAPADESMPVTPEKSKITSLGLLPVTSRATRS